MSTNTYVALFSYTVPAGGTSAVTIGSGGTIPQTYGDLVLVANGTDSANTSWWVEYNGDTTTSHYSYTVVYGDGSGAYSGRGTTNGYLGNMGTSNGTLISNIMNYANSTTYKTTVSQSTGGGIVTSYVCMWRGSTGSAAQPITSLTVKSASTIQAGTTFTLYGIANADTGAYATGGIITQDANYYYHAFGTSSTFTPTRNLTADVLIVAGGGGGGYWAGGGGGAGGVLALTSQSLTSGTGYTCTVGAGAPGTTTDGGTPAVAGNSVFNTTTAHGGGSGGGGSTIATSNYRDAANGGSGGGGGGRGGLTGTNYGTGISGEGTNGGASQTSNTSGTAAGGGGGGKGAAGSPSPSDNVAGAGGIGTSAYSSWLSVAGLGVLNSSDGLRYIAAGGGGGTAGGTGAAGGIGGGGSGVNGTAAISTTGSGGGSNSNSPYIGGNGASGLIIVRYAK